MSIESTGMADRVRELREAFDRSFAEPPAPGGAATENILEIGAGGASYALRMSEIIGLFPNRATTPLPTTVPALLGIAGFRGSILPVYDLAALLGAAAEEPPRWLVVAAGKPVGLTFPKFEGYLDVPRDAIHSRDDDHRPGRHLRAGVVLRGRMVPLISVESILAAISPRVPLEPPRQER